MFIGEVGYNCVFDIEGVDGDVSDVLDNDCGVVSVIVRVVFDYFNVMNGFDFKVIGIY